MEVIEEDLKAQLLREMEEQQAWKLYQGHLASLCKIKEVEKSAALRRNEIHVAIQKQFEIDGINLAVTGLHKLINGFSPKPDTP